MNSEPKCRWGILSAAGIARKNWRAIATSGNSELKAVAARNRESAVAFIQECQAHTPHPQTPDAVESYEALLSRNDIDAVYIPLPTGVRGEWIRRALESGKHVLAEKPVGLNAEQVQSFIDLANERGKQFMDGVMFMHSHRMKKMREVLEDGSSIGDLKRMAAHFSFRSDEAFLKSNIRVMSQFEPHGCLGDLGWYCIRLILWAKKYQMPCKVTGRVLQWLQGEGSPGKVPGECSGELFYDDGFSASFYCSFLTENQQWAHCSGTRGALQLDDFVLPFYGGEARFETNQAAFVVNGCDFHMHERRTTHLSHEYSEGHDNAQEVEMFRTFSQCVNSGKSDPFWPSVSLKTQRVLDAVLASAQNSSREITL
jgi:predicted dehydrogenase